MEPVLSFLTELARNNDREWFNQHKGSYQDSLESFRDFTALLIAGIVQFDPALNGRDPRDSIFRIYKDVRFSRDKSPYKTHFGAWMSKGGRKSADAGYYFHLEPGKSFSAAGVWMPPREELNLIRQEIYYDPAAYLKVIGNPLVRERYERGGREDMLKKGPAGFPGDFEHMEELKYKHYVFSRDYSDREVLSKDFHRLVVDDFRGLYPLVDYLNRAMSFKGNQ